MKCMPINSGVVLENSGTMSHDFQVSTEGFLFIVMSDWIVGIHS